MADLGRWLSGDYRVAGAIVEESGDADDTGPSNDELEERKQ
jgi:endogenous inhibitor of DNA gyrase (YacG/DUF329 family)